ncbi:RHS repeat protein [Pseudomonas sp. NBRC 111124]|uniref:RHS repeat protein n=1 Tax=Pseudomonas sp. NBRC 111124 TaxID=1661039 RepID=UPI000761BDD4|nr:RHS repeat protein [Pseudomonas sp. NBRC 111124]
MEQCITAKNCCHGTPVTRVVDNRNLGIAVIHYQRHPDTSHLTDMQISRHQYDARGFLHKSRDPRLDASKEANFTWLGGLTANRLYTRSVDSGDAIALSDIADRPLVTVSQLSTDPTGDQSTSQAVTLSYWYEPAKLPGRLIAASEQAAGDAPRLSERYLYAAPNAKATGRNLAGLCTHHYHTAGLLQMERVALTGMNQSAVQRLLVGADDPAAFTDWQGEDEDSWNKQLVTPDRAHASLATGDATGTHVTFIDACGHLQAQTYDIAGQLSGKTLTLHGQAQQVIVKALAYAATGETLFEEQGNGVSSRYTYEPRTQRMASVRTERAAAGHDRASLIQYLRYTYDPVGNVASVVNDAQATRYWRNQQVEPRNTFRYDSLYQLVQVKGREMANRGQQGVELPPVGGDDQTAYSNYTRSYAYDTAGNLLRIRHSAPASNNCYSIDITVSDRSNRAVLGTLASQPEQVEAQFTVGGQQHRLQPGQTLAWTHRAELRSVTPINREGDEDDFEHYRYDGYRQRLLKITTQLTSSGLQITICALSARPGIAQHGSRRHRDRGSADDPGG